MELQYFLAGSKTATNCHRQFIIHLILTRETATMRQKVIAGNWKMNNTVDEAKKLISEVTNILSDEKKNDALVVLCPPFPFLGLTKRLIASNEITVGAQNCHQELAGAYTGEISASMIKSMGAGLCYHRA